MTFLYFIAVMGLILAATAARNYVAFRLRGYRIFRRGRDRWVYEERTQSGRQSLVLDGEMMSRGPDLLYVADEAGWRLAAPTWATHRRSEILSRVMALSRGKLRLQ